MRRALGMSIIVLAGGWAGCVSSFGPQAEHGITFYCPGVANADLGDAGIRDGLERAGYRGQVVRMTWSVSLNPVIDQTVRIIAQQGGKRLADYIQEYIDEYPGRPVNVVGLSAGTGVEIWALEALKPRYQVDNVVLISSSLSQKYDVSRALPHVKGRIYNYYSSSDYVLAVPMKVFGTIDGIFLEDAAGAVGLRVPPDADERVVNIAWRPEFEKYGYYGGHGDGTSADFVRYEIARRLLSVPVESPETALATHSATTPRDAPPD